MVVARAPAQHCEGLHGHPAAFNTQVRTPEFHPEIQFDLNEHLIAAFSTKSAVTKGQIRAEHKQIRCSRKAENQLITPRLHKSQGLVLRSLAINWAGESSPLGSALSAQTARTLLLLSPQALPPHPLPSKAQQHLSMLTQAAELSGAGGS